jgi:hypothetical protein
MVVVERVIRDSDGGGRIPPLTRTNYVEWALLMKIQLEAASRWDVVNTCAERRPSSCVHSPSSLRRKLHGTR